MCYRRRAASASQRAHRHQRRCRSPRRQRRQIERSRKSKQRRRPLCQAAQVRRCRCASLIAAAETNFGHAWRAAWTGHQPRAGLGGQAASALLQIRLSLCRCLGRLRKDSWQIPEGKWTYKNGSNRLSSEQCSAYEMCSRDLCYNTWRAEQTPTSRRVSSPVDVTLTVCLGAAGEARTRAAEVEEVRVRPAGPVSARRCDQRPDSDIMMIRPAVCPAVITFVKH